MDGLPMTQEHEVIVMERAALKRNIEASEVAQAAVFLLSDGASGITGQTLYVDAGFNIMGIEQSVAG